MEHRDVVIIGGGPAGYSAAIRAAQLGGTPILIENDALGGTCLNHGCIPTRALFRATEFLDLGAHAKDYGVLYRDVEIDINKMMARKDIVVKTLVGGIKLLLGGNGVKILEGTASFLSPSQLEVTLPDHTKKEISANKIIIATGSRPQECVVPGADSGRIIDTTKALSLKEIPSSMLIVGGQFIGVSFATIFSRLGTKVTVIEESQGMLAEMDREIVTIFEKELKKNKVQYHPDARLVRLDKGPGDEMEAFIDVKGQEVKLPVQYVVVADKREANSDGIGLDHAGVKVNNKRGIIVNERMETNIPNIFAAGDVTMEHMFTPVAYMEGITAAENAMGKNSTVNYRAIPLWTQTIPGISGVGMTEDKAVEAGYEVRVGRFPLAANGMATIMGQRTGLIKVVTDAQYGQIIGVHAIGPSAADLVAEAALAIQSELTWEDVSMTYHAHPSLSEAFWEAVKDVNGEALHFVSPKK